MSFLRFTCTVGVALALAGCGKRPAATPQQLSTATDAEQEKYQPWFAQARQLEMEADVLLTVNGSRHEHSVRLVRPVLPRFTNELSSAADFQALATALPKHDTAVIRLWAVGWDTNRVTNAVSHLRQVGFHSIRAVAMRWGQFLPGPSL
jgi:outer membrane PBP1 activator LpoA protein